MKAPRGPDRRAALGSAKLNASEPGGERGPARVAKPDSKSLHASQPGGSLRVVAISGSLRADNLTRRALQIALRGAESEGAETELVDLALIAMPFCDERPDDAYPEDVQKLRRAVGAAHGILLGSPEYHGSLSGSLKNAIDLLGFEHFEGKMVGLVAVAGGSLSATGTLAHMRTICRHLHAWVVPRQVSISRSQDALGAAGHLKDPAHEARLLEVGRDVAHFASLHFGLHAGSAPHPGPASGSRPRT